MLVAQGTFSHVRQLDGSLGARIHEPVTALGMKLRSSDDLCQLFHVCWLDIDNIEALVLDVEVPEIDPKVIAADEGFTITVHGYAVDVIRMCVCIGLPGHSSNHSVMVRKAGKLKISRRLELRWPDRPAASRDATSWRQLVRQVILRHNLQRLLKHLP